MSLVVSISADLLIASSFLCEYVVPTAGGWQHGGNGGGAPELFQKLGLFSVL